MVEKQHRKLFTREPPVIGRIGAPLVRTINLTHDELDALQHSIRSGNPAVEKAILGALEQRIRVQRRRDSHHHVVSMNLDDLGVTISVEGPSSLSQDEVHSKTLIGMPLASGPTIHSSAETPPSTVHRTTIYLQEVLKDLSFLSHFPCLKELSLQGAYNFTLNELEILVRFSDLERLRIDLPNNTIKCNLHGKRAIRNFFRALFVEHQRAFQHAPFQVVPQTRSRFARASMMVLGIIAVGTAGEFVASSIRLRKAASADETVEGALRDSQRAGIRVGQLMEMGGWKLRKALKDPALATAPSSAAVSAPAAAAPDAASKGSDASPRPTASAVDNPNLLLRTDSEPYATSTQKSAPAPTGDADYLETDIFKGSIEIRAIIGDEGERIESITPRVSRGRAAEGTSINLESQTPLGNRTFEAILRIRKGRLDKSVRLKFVVEAPARTTGQFLARIIELDGKSVNLTELEFDLEELPSL